MEYYKDLKQTKKDRRLIGRKGPRDLQRQQAQQLITQPIVQTVDSGDEVIELRKQVSMLLEELAKKPVVQEATGSAAAKKYTAEEFDEELVKQITLTLKEVEVKHLEEVNELKLKLSLQQRDGGKEASVTAEQYKKEIGILKNSIKEIEQEYFTLEKEIESLQTKLESKDAVILSKDETIESLKLRSVSDTVEFIEDPDRPAMETIFIDPNEKGDGDKLVSHIEVEGQEDSKIGDQVDKLKGLIGGLPKK